MSKIDNLNPQNKDDDKIVTVKTSGKKVKISKTANTNKKSSSKKVSKACKKENPIEENIKSERRRHNELKDIIDTNFVDPSYCLFVTLTYKENMTDYKKLSKDYKKFVEKSRGVLGEYEYIVVKELQERGAWHLHFLMFFNGKAPRVKGEILQNIWGKGIVKVSQSKNGNFYGFYFIKKLKMNPERLALYPKNFRLYSCSKGIKRPTRERISQKEAEARVKGMTKLERESYSGFIFGKDGQVINYYSVKSYMNTIGMNEEEIEFLLKHRYFKKIEQTQEESQVEEIKKINEENHLTHEEQEQNENNVTVTIFRKHEKKNNAKIDTRIKNRIYWQIKERTLMFSKPIYLLTARLRR